MPIIDFRNNYEKGYVDQFYGKRTSDLLQFNWKHLLKPGKHLLKPGKPDQFRLLYKKDFINEGTAKKNIRLKWIAMCLVMDYVTGEVGRKPRTEFHRACLNDLLSWRLFLFQVELYINGAKSPQKNKKPIERPEDHAGLVFMLFHKLYKLYFHESWVVSENLWWSVLGTTTMTRLH